jgi:hypothetical protein
LATEAVREPSVHQVRAERNDATETRQDPALTILTSPAEAAGLNQYIQRLRKQRIEVAALEVVKEDGPIGFQGIEIAEIDLGVMTIQPLDGAK